MKPSWGRPDIRRARLANWWIEGQVGSKVAKRILIPKKSTDGFSIQIWQRERGFNSQVLTITGAVRGKVLVLTVQNERGEKSELKTRR